MASKAERTQKAAHDAHQRGQRALARGDVEAAMRADDTAHRLAVNAMVQRMREARERDAESRPDGG